MKHKNNMKIFIGLVLTFLGICALIVSENIKEMFHPKKPVPIIINTNCIDTTFSVKDFVLELHLQNIKYPDIVLRQACQESAYFTSPIWKEKNNPFGFYHSIDSVHGEYILFNDWRASITYMKSWQDKRYKSGEDYYLFLSRIRYATDTNYIEALKKINLNILRKQK